MSGLPWRRIDRSELSALESFLRSRESEAVGFIGRILREDRLRLPNPFRGGIWVCEAGRGKIGGALLASPGRVFFPLLPEDDAADEALPRALGTEFSAPSSLIGPADSVERLRSRLGLEPRAEVAYRLMLKRDPGFSPRAAAQSFPALLVRRALGSDLDALYPLQAAYEAEEVLTPIHEFDPDGCRLALAHTLAEQLVVTAFLDGRCVGKAGTNARSFDLDQIGGVFVKPELRSKGIGRALMEALLDRIEAQEKGAVLFVKVANLPARALYAGLGFEELLDFRAEYFEA